MSYGNDDLVWSKLGGYPFWPSFISPEPSTGLISKGCGSKLAYHVTFLGDNSHSWVPASCVRTFLAEDTGPDRSSDYRCAKNWETDHTRAMKLALDLLLEQAGLVKTFKGKLVEREKPVESLKQLGEELSTSEVEYGGGTRVENTEAGITSISGDDSPNDSNEEIVSNFKGESSNDDESKSKEKVQSLSKIGESRKLLVESKETSKTCESNSNHKGEDHESKIESKSKFAESIHGIRKLEEKNVDKSLKEDKEVRNKDEHKSSNTKKGGDLKKGEKSKIKDTVTYCKTEHKKHIKTEEHSTEIMENKYDIIKKRKHKSERVSFDKAKDSHKGEKRKHSHEGESSGSKNKKQKKSKDKVDKWTTSDKKTSSQRSIESCGECRPCLASNCGSCQFCLDSPSFGGPGLLTSLVICSQRICYRQGEILLGKSKSEIQIGNKKEPKHHNEDQFKIAGDDKKKVVEKKYSSDENNNDDSPSPKKVVPVKKKRQSTKGCGCDGCLSQNCGECIYCLDMKCFGGLGKKRQRCKQRQCHLKGIVVQRKKKGVKGELLAGGRANEDIDDKKQGKYSTRAVGRKRQLKEEIISVDYPTSSKISYEKVKESKVEKASFERTQKVVKSVNGKKRPKPTRISQNPLSHLTSGESSDFSELEDLNGSLSSKVDKGSKDKKALHKKSAKFGKGKDALSLGKDKHNNRIKSNKANVCKESKPPTTYAVPPRCEEGLSINSTENEDSDQEAPLGNYKIPKTKPDSNTTLPGMGSDIAENIQDIKTQIEASTNDEVVDIFTENIEASTSVASLTEENVENSIAETSLNTIDKIVQELENKVKTEQVDASGLSLIQEYDDETQSSDSDSDSNSISSSEADDVTKKEDTNKSLFCATIDTLEDEAASKEDSNNSQSCKPRDTLVDDNVKKEDFATEKPVVIDSFMKKRKSRWDVPPGGNLTSDDAHQSSTIETIKNEISVSAIPVLDHVDDKNSMKETISEKKPFAANYTITKIKETEEKSCIQSTDHNSSKDIKNISEKEAKSMKRYSDGRRKHSSQKEAKNSKTLVDEPGKHTWGNYPSQRYKYQFGPIPQYDVSIKVLKKLPRKNIFDSHCRLDLLFNKLNHPDKISQGYLDYQLQSFSEFQSQFSSEIPKNFEGCITNFCDPKLWNVIGTPVLLNSLEKEPGIYYTLGCHPHHAEKLLAKNCMNVLERLLKWGKGGRCVALGECGLDLSANKTNWSNTKLEVQKRAFKFQLELAMKLDLPLVLHIRDAEQHAIDVMKKAGVPADYPMHRHCFNDTWQACQEWMRIFPRCYIGLTNLVTYNSARHVHEIASLIPLERLILETGAPYFPPRLNSPGEPSHHGGAELSHHGGTVSNVPSGVVSLVFPVEVSHPGHVVHAAAQVAQLRDISLDAVLAANRKNVAKLYKIKEKKSPRILNKID